MLKMSERKINKVKTPVHGLATGGDGLPIFEYKCHNCNEIFEYLVRTKDEIVVCPKCNSQKLTKLMSTFASSVTRSTDGTTQSCNTCADGVCNMFNGI